VLHKMADLDVQNTDVRLKLAEAYLKEGLQQEAAQAFAEAGLRLLENRSYEKSLQANSRALEIRPQYQPAIEGTVKAHIALAPLTKRLRCWKNDCRTTGRSGADLATTYVVSRGAGCDRR